MKNKILSIVFVSFITAFMFMFLIFKDETVSYSERRHLADFPSFKFSNEYIEDLEKYFLDHFPFRETFRSIKAYFNLKVLNKLDNNGIYIKDDYIFKSNFPTDEKSIENFVINTEKLASLFSSSNFYMMIIPDKNYYLEDEDFLHIDYDYIYERIDKLNFTDIDIRDSLKLEDFYETDTHWRQENLTGVLNKMATAFGYKYRVSQLNQNIYDKFYGVYYGESAIDRKPEKLIYLSNEIIDDARVVYLENKNLNSIYNEEKLTGFDSYEVFLDGASSYIEIYNERYNGDRELIIFRDSFASSLVPLLVENYSKITLIDNRYINSKYFNDLIEHKNRDVLFMYSTLSINNSYSLKG